MEIETEKKTRTVMNTSSVSDSSDSEDICDMSDSEMEESTNEKKVVAKHDLNGDLSSNVSEDIKQERVK